jgi:hypothetical protein
VGFICNNYDISSITQKISNQQLAEMGDFVNTVQLLHRAKTLGSLKNLIDPNNKNFILDKINSNNDKTVTSTLLIKNK